MENAGRQIPNSLKRYRRMYGYSQKDAMVFLGLRSAGRISQWEKGSAMPSPQNLFKLSILYRTISDQFYTDYIADMKRNMSEKQKAIVSKHLHKKKTKSKRK